MAYALRGVPGEPASHTERVFAALDSLEASGARTSVGAVDAAAVAEAGAHAPLAVGYALAAFVSWLRAVEGAGRDLSVETARAVVSLALSGEVLVDVATVRALRRGLARVTAKAGLAAAPRLLARSLRRGLSTLDPHTNLLRVTNGTVAALAAGAELVAPAPFDVGSKGPSNESALARRMARRTFLVLTHEAHLGRTLDPAGGAYAIEALTDAVGRAAFGYFTELERAGGLEKPAARAELAAWLAQSSAEAERDARTRKRPFVGASEVPDVGAPVRGDFSPSPLGELGLLAPRRDAAPFELVRARASGSPAVLVALVALGGPKEAAARVGFARGLVEVAGARTLLVDASRPDWEATLRASGARAAVLCATDARYEAEAVAAARAVQGAGASLVALAGKPGATEAAQREAGVGLYVHLGCDVPAALERLLDAGLGATGARAHGPTAAGEQATEGGVA